MDYGALLNRSFNIVWQNKFLILLGILVSLAGGSSSSGGEVKFENGSGQFFPELSDEFTFLAVGLIVVLICAALVVGILLWAISTIARGGMIAGVDAVETGEESSFRQSWSAGWAKAGTLLGIGILPGIPGLFLFVAGLFALGGYGGLFTLFNEEVAQIGGAGLALAIASLACIVVPIILILSILRNFAERACMLEDLGVVDSYRRGTSVLRANLGEAIILFVIQIVMFIVLGVLVFLPGLILVLCCLLWPLLLVVQGAVSAFVSTLWTLAWRTWTGEPTKLEDVPSST
jgi:hypothetical protein